MYHEKERAESALSDFFLAMKKGHHAPSSILVCSACVLSNGCKSPTSPDSGNRIARKTRVSIVSWNLKEGCGKHLA